MQNTAATYLLSGVRLQTEAADEITVGQPSTAWISPVLSGGLFALLGVFLIMSGKDSSLLGLVGLALAVFMVSVYPISSRMTFNLITRKVTFTANYLIHLPMRVQRENNVDNLVRAVLKQGGLVNRGTVEVLFADGMKVSLNFGNRKAEAERFASRVNGLVGNAETPAQKEAVDLASVRSSARNELSSWRYWLIIIGVFQMVQAHGFSPWGALLIVLGLASFYFDASPMFIVYAVTVAWAGISNLQTGSAYWILFAALQAYIVFQLFRQFRKANRAEHLSTAAFWGLRLGWPAG